MQPSDTTSGPRPIWSRAIVNKHSQQVEKKRGELLCEIEGSTNVRDWISCLVRASTDHYAEMGGPTWYARFSAQILTDPVLRKIVYDEGTGLAHPAGDASGTL